MNLAESPRQRLIDSADQARRIADGLDGDVKRLEAQLAEYRANAASWRARCAEFERAATALRTAGVEK